MSCAADPAVGVAIRLADYLDCSARTLGEQGFQAVADQALGTGLVSGLVTIFVALIGYRLLLGHMPSLRDGVTWAVRLGIVLTLVTSWPAFQTVAYRAVVDSPVEIAGVMLPAVGAPLEQLDARIQAAYDAMRLGTATAAAPPPQQAEAAGPFSPAQPQAQPATTSYIQAPLPQTASLLVITTSGVIGAMRLAAGFLLAVAPLAFLGLLFDATSGLLGGWIRAVAGSALGVLAATAVAGLELAAVEGEIAARALYGPAGATADQQALTVIVLLFAVVMLAAVVAANRMVGFFRLPLLQHTAARDGVSVGRSSVVPMFNSEPAVAAYASRASGGVTAAPSRAAGVADALATSVRREQDGSGSGGGAGAWSSRGTRAATGNAEAGAPYQGRSAAGGRRTMRRSSRSAARRDRLG